MPVSLSMVGGWGLQGLAFPTFVFGIGRYVERERALGDLLSKPGPSDRVESPMEILK